jgi:hypothetical protein
MFIVIRDDQIFAKPILCTLFGKRWGNNRCIIEFYVREKPTAVESAYHKLDQGASRRDRQQIGKPRWLREGAAGSSRDAYEEPSKRYAPYAPAIIGEPDRLVRMQAAILSRSLWKVAIALVIPCGPEHLSRARGRAAHKWRTNLNRFATNAG